MRTLFLAVSLMATAPLAFTSKKLACEVDRVKLEGVLLFEEDGEPRPGLVLVPNWLGITEANVKQAELVANRGYAVFVADLFDVTGRPKNQDEAGKAAGALKSNRPLMHARVKQALEVFFAEAFAPKK